MIKKLKVACLQINAKSAIDVNLVVIEVLVREARAQGAHIALMPENTVLISKKIDDILFSAKPTIIYLALVTFRALATELQLWLHCGSLIVHTGKGRIINRTYFLNHNGEISATYDKIHMFDANLENVYQESSVLVAGNRIVVMNTPWGKVGLSICYDLRFPQLYCTLAHKGAVFLVVPAAFTKMTGKAHWHVLLQARAIENSCYILAPAQTGTHANNRETYGHTLIVNPWGKILADACKASPSLAVARINLEKIRIARERIPRLKTDFSIV